MRTSAVSGYSARCCIIYSVSADTQVRVGPLLYYKAAEQGPYLYVLLLQDNCEEFEPRTLPQGVEPSLHPLPKPP